MAKTGSKPIDELVRLAIIGDGAAFTKLWDTHIVSLRAYLKTNIKTLDDFFIGDICSRSFEKAFRQINTFDPSRSQFGTWLKSIAYHTALDILEQENRSRKKYVLIDESSIQHSAVDNISDDVDTPLESIIKDEDREKNEHYVEALPELYREVARRRLIEGMSYKEIAEELGMELNTVRTRIRRAKAIMEGMKND